MSLTVRILNRLFSHREIVNCDRELYLRRWYVIRTAPFAVFIHKFVRSDEDRALHDHPWSFLVIPIWRGYWEHREIQWKCACIGPKDSEGRCIHCLDSGYRAIQVIRRVLPILGTRFRHGTYRHRVELLPCDDSTVCTYFEDPNEFDVDEDCPKCAGTGDLPSWSIFIRFREFRDWGFHMPDGWVQWNKFWQDKCE